MTMTSGVERSGWAELTNRLSADHAGHAGHDVTIEVVDAEGGDNPVVVHLPFHGITYDHQDDVLVISVGGRPPHHPVVLRHLVHSPQEVLFDLIPRGAALKITDAAGATTLVSLLRSPEGQGGRGS
ncbi:DUF5335 family protein [Modestobacter sp. VKM Ac-2985]|uniref:DUF5335 family protein n=1 Tax=Modestobacter sp. VKM Ac-2985 TaxID=3004139 RepID=UPI0022AB7DA1|nr:DUF5335 family protein [Modestobacter sp. VKM Ac-2985]MCZ2839127.1 DUF5335 family protein [Modestobacter sp. VKM Ac-2985]